MKINTHSTLLRNKLFVFNNKIYKHIIFKGHAHFLESVKAEIAEKHV